MKRFLRTFILLLAGLLLLASGVNSTLDRLSRAPAGNSFTWYSEKGEPVLVFDGEQALMQRFPRPAHATSTSFFHRTSGGFVASTHAAARSRYF